MTVRWDPAYQRQWKKRIFVGGIISLCCVLICLAFRRFAVTRPIFAPIGCLVGIYVLVLGLVETVRFRSITFLLATLPSIIAFIGWRWFFILEHAAGR
jgi:hypothetical protein